MLKEAIASTVMIVAVSGIAQASTGFPDNCKRVEGAAVTPYTHYQLKTDSREWDSLTIAGTDGQVVVYDNPQQGVPYAAPTVDGTVEHILWIEKCTVVPTPAPSPTPTPPTPTTAPAPQPVTTELASTGFNTPVLTIIAAMLVGGGLFLRRKFS